MIEALEALGPRVPDDLSVVGFDDIQSAAFQNPSLTTIRQPLRNMGEIAARNMTGDDQSFQTFAKETLAVDGQGRLHSSFWDFD